MRYRFFTISIRDDGAAAEELNRFLAAHRIISVDRHLIADAANSAWAVCVAFDDPGSVVAAARSPAGKRGKIDYRDVLTEPEFAVFARLRALRKDQADADAVPAYAVPRRRTENAARTGGRRFPPCQ